MDPNTSLNQEQAFKKMRKRLQLKNLLVNKFRNKYFVTAYQGDELNHYIQDQLDELFDS